MSCLPAGSSVPRVGDSTVTVAMRASRPVKMACIGVPITMPVWRQRWRSGCDAEDHSLAQEGHAQHARRAKMLYLC